MDNIFNQVKLRLVTQTSHCRSRTSTMFCNFFLTLFTRVCSSSSKAQWIVGNISLYSEHVGVIDHLGL